MSTKNKYFTVEEANAIVPQVLIDIPRLQELMDDLTQKYPDVKKAREKAHLNGGSLQGIDYINCVFKINCLTGELESKGCILKGIKHGLVDFLSLRGVKVIYLCWKIPEQLIEYCHDLQSGFAGRQRI